jgi:hypothetical protein
VPCPRSRGHANRRKICASWGTPADTSHAHASVGMAPERPILAVPPSASTTSAFMVGASSRHFPAMSLFGRAVLERLIEPDDSGSIRVPKRQTGGLRSGVPLVVTLDNSDKWTETRHATASAGSSDSRTYLCNAIENRTSVSHSAFLLSSRFAVARSLMTTAISDGAATPAVCTRFRLRYQSGRDHTTRTPHILD